MPRYTDVEPYEQFIKSLHKIDEEPWTTFAQAAYYTGTRESELIRVTPDDVCFDKDKPEYINIKIHTLKNKRSKIRYVPINKNIEPQAVKLFLSIKETKLPDEPMFYNQNIPEQTFLRRLRRSINDLYDGVAPHYFRHCRLTHCITKFNFTDYELMQYAGWTDVRPGSYYVHLRVQNLQDKMK